MQMPVKFMSIYSRRIHLLPLNRILDGVELILTDKLKLNPDKTEFIVSGSK